MIDNKPKAADEFQDAHQYIEADANKIIDALNTACQVEDEPLPDMTVTIQGTEYKLGLWSTDVIHILDTAFKTISNFAASQYTK